MNFLLSVSTVTTADAVAQGPTVLAHVLALTVVALHLADIRPHLSSPTSSPRPATTAIATPSLVDAIATVEVEDLVTRGSAHVLGHGLALRSKQTGIGTERGKGRETETAVPLTSPQRNTNMTEEVVTEETGGTGTGLDPMTGTERGSVATRANTTVVVGTQDIAVTGAETHTPLTDRL